MTRCTACPSPGLPSSRVGPAAPESATAAGSVSGWRSRSPRASQFALAHRSSEPAALRSRHWPRPAQSPGSSSLDERCTQRFVMGRALPSATASTVLGADHPGVPSRPAARLSIASVPPPSFQAVSLDSAAGHPAADARTRVRHTRCGVVLRDRSARPTPASERSRSSSRGEDVTGQPISAAARLQEHGLTRALRPLDLAPLLHAVAALVRPLASVRTQRGDHRCGAWLSTHLGRPVTPPLGPLESPPQCAATPATGRNRCSGCPAV